MSYQPYTSGNTNNTQKNSASASASSYNPYQNVRGATPAAAPASSYNPYQNVPKTTATTTAGSSGSDYNPYQNVVSSPASVPAPASSYNPYGAAPNATATTSASSYNPYENIHKAPATVQSATMATTATSQLPDFSQALDLPPPTASTSTTYGRTTTKGKNDFEPTAPAATAYPMGGTGQSSLVNSTTYQGGPTGGIVSEGNPVKCHKVDYEIKGHEMQLVE